MRYCCVNSLAKVSVMIMIGTASGAQPSNGAGGAPYAAAGWLQQSDIVTLPGLPDIGKWMMTLQGVPSDWLGEVYEGKNLREPINVIILDESSASVEEAKSRLLLASTLAGYPIRFGHSTGYQGYIGGQFHAQLPHGRDDAFSNDIFEVSNNHGRVFGPHLMGRTYVFTAAFSREEVDPFRLPGHRYASFNRARDDFTQSLDRSTAYKVSGFVDLNNAIVGDPKLTTGDHDGMAVLVRQER
jgi:hypothetical protein